MATSQVCATPVHPVSLPVHALFRSDQPLQKPLTHRPTALMHPTPHLCLSISLHTRLSAMRPVLFLGCFLAIPKPFFASVLLPGLRVYLISFLISICLRCEGLEFRAGPERV